MPRPRDLPAELADKIGMPCMVQLESVKVPCKIVDVKFAYGNLRYEIAPIDGEGSQWVDAGRVDEELI